MGSCLPRADTAPYTRQQKTKNINKKSIFTAMLAL
jgi:hypothetical protein